MLMELLVNYHGQAKDWDDIKAQAAAGKIPKVFIGETEFVRVVRCKECVHNYANQIPSEDVCDKCVELPITADFYCAYGRKENR